MSTVAEMTLEELEAKVRERMELIKRIVGFAEAITQARGRVTKREEQSWNTYIERKLEHFGGFSFHCSSGHGMMGGNDVEVWRTPQTQCVFSVDYQVKVEECNVRTFRDSEEWLPALLHLIEHKDEVTAQIMQTEEEERERRRELAEENQKRAKLLEQARKLKL